MTKQPTQRVAILSRLRRKSSASQPAICRSGLSELIAWSRREPTRTKAAPSGIFKWLVILGPGLIATWPAMTLVVLRRTHRPARSLATISFG